MKQIIITLSLIILCAQHALFSMDLNTHAVQPNLSPENIIATIHNEINKNYSSKDLLYDWFKAVQLVHEQLLDIMQITAKNCPTNITIDMTNMLDELYKQNAFFNKAIDHFVKYASSNFALITANNIQTIENPQKQQPTPELNNLSLPIKTYVMNCALQQIPYKYDIILTDQYLHDIQVFDICELTDQSVTSGFHTTSNPFQWNNRFLLWDLKKGDAIRKFDESSPIALLAFNPDGSSIAAALHNENTIKIWCPKTGKLLHQLSSCYRTDSLYFSHPKGSILTAVCGIHSEQPIITQWTLGTNYNAGELINCSYVHHGRTKNNGVCGNKYEAIAPKGNELHITKKNCGPFYLCMQAMKKANSTTIHQVTTSVLYHQLTDLEKRLFHIAINTHTNK